MPGARSIFHQPRRLFWLLLALLLVGVSYAGLLLRRHFLAAAGPIKPHLLTVDGSFALSNSLPTQGGPPGYVTSSACKECHARQYDTWWHSYHRQMTQVMNRNTVQAQFEGTVLYSGGARFTLHEAGNHYWVDIQGVEEFQAALLTNGPAPAPTRIPMEMVTGSHHFQVFWLPTGHGNRQIGFPFTWLVREKHWVPRNDAFIRDPDMEPRPEQWNVICIRCHATGGRPMPDPEKQVFKTHVTELGIACEACHGPGEAHVTTERKHPTKSAQAHSEIVQPGHLDHVRSSQVCGFCHSMKWFEKNQSWNQNGFSYRPGDDLEQTTPVMRPTKVAEQPWLSEVLSRQPDIFNDFFWPDGMVRVTGREYNGLLESACYQKGDLACTSCHSMHKSDPDKQLKEGKEGNQACLACHTKYEAKLSEHTHHAKDSAGSLCYNCHMPYTSYGLLRGVRSHQIDRPTVLSNLKVGRPNACNQCHLNKTLQWTAERLTEWYRQPMPTLPEESQNVSETVRMLLSGDTGQRALAAFSMGWESALAASGKDWEAPLLVDALDDRYAAVRFIAHRSLTHLPGFQDFGYDFESSPDQRHASQKNVLDRWRTNSVSLPNRQETLTGPGPQIDTNTFLRLVEHRDNRPVHLRE